jgi:hypothetical protein
MSILRRTFCFLLAAGLFITAHRLPAPIVETPEKPTPAPEEEASKPKHSSRSKRKSEEAAKTEASKPQPRTPQERFAGTWTGTISQGLWGKVVFTFTLTAGATEVTERSGFGTYAHPATSDGKSATWRTGLLNEITWTFTPNSDGTTAQVTAKSPLGVNGSASFHRGGTPATSKSQQVEIPTARADPNRPGFVYNPYDPTASRLLDVRGKPSGSKVKDPVSGRFFIVP